MILVAALFRVLSFYRLRFIYLILTLKGHYHERVRWHRLGRRPFATSSPIRWTPNKCNSARSIRALCWASRRAPRGLSTSASSNSGRDVGTVLRWTKRGNCPPSSLCPAPIPTSRKWPKPPKVSNLFSPSFPLFLFFSHFIGRAL